MLKVLKYTAVWCKPCKEMEEVEKLLPFPIIKMDIENPYVDSKHINSLPTYVFVKNDRIVETVEGTCSKERLIKIHSKYETD